LNGAYRNTEDREPIPPPVINRRRLRHYTTETQTAVPLLCVQCIPITKNLTRTDSDCVICLDPKEEEADIVALRCAHMCEIIEREKTFKTAEYKSKENVGVIVDHQIRYQQHYLERWINDLRKRHQKEKKKVPDM
ncbi:hypothetical protein AM593_09404, partial [Mytilus galloprovincialis]